VLGIDAHRASMERASRLAARPRRKGGLPNACFVVASAEALPCELAGRADEVRLHLPWGSLLRGFARGEAAIVEPLARICAPGAQVIALVSSIERDGLAIRLPEDVVAAAPAYAEAGLALREVRSATADDVRAIGTTWAMRLSVGRDRAAFIVRLDGR
jgi:16S rRNA (adenine(1408)-N(1))-methyltransferase